MRKMIGLVLVLFFLLCSAKPNFEVDMLDVGQGDGIYIQTEEGLYMFVDGGSTSLSKVGTYRILPFLKFKGARKIDYWFLTHPDEDHVSGFLEALEADYTIKNLVISKTLRDDFSSIVAKAEEKGTSIVYVSEGDKIITDSVQVECYYPPLEAVYEGANENSLVFLLSTQEMEMLFTGDIAQEQEKYLIENQHLRGKWSSSEESQQKIHVLKVAHHGSKNASSQEFLDALAPNLALISAGEDNRYGHPHKETLERLESVGSQIIRVDESGQISLLVERGECVKKMFHDSHGRDEKRY